MADSGRTNNVAACGGPFCGYDCRSEGIIFAAELGWLDVHSRDTDMAAALFRLRSPMGPDLGSIEPDSDPRRGSRARTHVRRTGRPDALLGV